MISNVYNALLKGPLPIREIISASKVPEQGVRASIDFLIRKGHAFKEGERRGTKYGTRDKLASKDVDALTSEFEKVMESILTSIKSSPGLTKKEIEEKLKSTDLTSVFDYLVFEGKIDYKGGRNFKYFLADALPQKAPEETKPEKKPEPSKSSKVKAKSPPHTEPFRAKDREQQIPSSMQRAYRGRVRSRSLAVIAMCQECCGYDRKAVRTCSDEGCPLWHWRPYQVSDDESADEQEAENAQD